MAERLTDKNHEAINECGEFSSCYSCRKEVCYITQICEKLGQLEDILEKYGIESVEELEKEMHSLMLIISILNDYGIEDYNELDEILKEFSYMKKIETEIGKELKFYKTDRDTWKRACELACDVILRFTDGCPCKADYFYQQAKKEGENNDTNN